MSPCRTPASRYGSSAGQQTIISLARRYFNREAGSRRRDLDSFFRIGQYAIKIGTPARRLLLRLPRPPPFHSIRAVSRRIPCPLQKSADAPAATSPFWPNSLAASRSRSSTPRSRARAQDEPVLYAHALPGLDVLICTVRGAQPPYSRAAELRRRCIESVAHALEQPLDGLECGGYWYEANGAGFLVFASRARTAILPQFCSIANRRSHGAEHDTRRPLRIRQT